MATTEGQKIRLLRRKTTRIRSLRHQLNRHRNWMSRRQALREQLRQVRDEKSRRRVLKELRNTPLSDRRTRRSIKQRIRKSEQRYNEIYRNLTRKNPTIGVGNLHRPRVPRNKSGIDVRVEISLDGKYFSNPAPTIPGDSTIWVRVVVTDTTTQEVGVTNGYEIAHVDWKIPAGYSKLDTLNNWGHDVMFVSNPLIITRKFTAPASETNKNWLVIVRAMERFDE